MALWYTVARLGAGHFSATPPLSRLARVGSLVVGLKQSACGIFNRLQYMFIGPVFTREVTIAPRREWTYILRSVYVGLLLLLVVTAWLVISGTQLITDPGDFARFGTMLFQFLAPVQLVLAIFFAATLAASAVGQEKERGTLLLLLMTRMTNRELVLGKLLASLLNIITMLAVSIPVFMAVAMLGGVSYYQIVRVLVVTFFCMLACGSLGSCVALWRDKTFQAIATTILIMVLWIGLWESIPALRHWAAVFSPWSAIVAASRPALDLSTGLFGPIQSFMIGCGLLVIGINAIAIAFVRVWNPSREARTTTAEVDTWHKKQTEQTLEEALAFDQVAWNVEETADGRRQMAAEREPTTVPPEVPEVKAWGMHQRTYCALMHLLLLLAFIPFPPSVFLLKYVDYSIFHNFFLALTLMVVLPFIPFLPVTLLVITFLWASQRNKNQHIDLHGRIILNWVFTCSMVLMGGWASLLCVIVFFDVSNFMAAFEFPLLLITFALIAVFLAHYVFAIIGAIETSRGIAWKYPLSIPFFKVSPNGDTVAGSLPSAKKIRHAWNNPIIWREIVTQAYGRRIWIIQFGFLAFFAMCAWTLHTVVTESDVIKVSQLAGPLIPLFLLSLILVNAQAITSQTSEKDGGTFDLILASDITPKEYVFGKLGGVFYNMKWIVLFPLALCGYLYWHSALSGTECFYLLVGLIVLYAFVAMVGIYIGMQYDNTRAATATSLGLVFFLFVGIAACIWIMVAFSGSFETQLVPFAAFMVGGGIGLYVTLGARNPSSAITTASFSLPIAVFYMITSMLLGKYMLVFAVLCGAFGFTTAAMLIPSVAEFDVATGRTTAD